MSREFVFLCTIQGPLFVFAAMSRSLTLSAYIIHWRPLMFSRTVSQSNRRKRFHRALQHLETLESRTLLSITASPPYSVPGVDATWESYDAAGHLWVYDSAFGRIVDTSGSININIASISANGFAMGTGHIYVSDARGGIDD